MCATRFNSIIALSALVCADLGPKPMEYFSNTNKGDFELGVVVCARKPSTQEIIVRDSKKQTSHKQKQNKRWFVKSMKIFVTFPLILVLANFSALFQTIWKFFRFIRYNFCPGEVAT